MSKRTAIVGGASRALTIAARFAAVMPEGAAAALVGGLLGDSAGIAKGYLERKERRQAERIEAIRHEVLDRRLARIEEELEVSDEQVDLAIHVFRKALEDDESQKERYYGALLELVLRNEIDVRTLKVLVSAVESLAKSELDQFMRAAGCYNGRFHFNPWELRHEGLPIQPVISRLTAVSLVGFEIKSEAVTITHGGGALEPKTETVFRLTAYGERMLWAVNREEVDASLAEAAARQAAEIRKPVPERPESRPMHPWEPKDCDRQG